MSSKTKIIVLHMKEVIYTCIFLLLLVILGVLVFFMFPEKHRIPLQRPIPDIPPAFTARLSSSTIIPLTWK